MEEIHFPEIRKGSCLLKMISWMKPNTLKKRTVLETKHASSRKEKNPQILRSKEPHSAPAQKEKTVKKTYCVNLPHTPDLQQAFIKWNTHQMQLFCLIPSQTAFEFQTLRKRFPYDPPLSPFMISPSKFQHLSDKTHWGGFSFICKACVSAFP